MTTGQVSIYRDNGRELKQAPHMSGTLIRSQVRQQVAASQGRDHHAVTGSRDARKTLAMDKL